MDLYLSIISHDFGTNMDSAKQIELLHMVTQSKYPCQFLGTNILCTLNLVNELSFSLCESIIKNRHTYETV